MNSSNASFFGSPEAHSEYLGLRSTSERVPFLYRLPMVQEFFRRDSERLLGGQAGGFGKSCHESKRFRELGNAAFKAGADEKALRLYHEAVAFAPRPVERGGKKECKVKDETINTVYDMSFVGVIN